MATIVHYIYYYGAFEVFAWVGLAFNFVKNVLYISSFLSTHRGIFCKEQEFTPQLNHLEFSVLVLLVL